MRVNRFSVNHRCGHLVYQEDDGGCEEIMPDFVQHSGFAQSLPPVCSGDMRAGSDAVELSCPDAYFGAVGSGLLGPC